MLRLTRMEHIFLVSWLVFTCSIWFVFFWKSRSDVCPPSGVLTMVETTDAEEALWGYTVLLGVRANNLTRKSVYIPDEVSDVLSEYFPNLSLEIIESLPKTCQSVVYMRYPLRPRDLKKLSTDEIHTVIDFSENPVEYTDPVWYSSTIKQDFKFHSSLINASNEFIKTKTDYNGPFIPKDIVCVWISTRGEFSQFKQKAPSRKKFFLHAVRTFRMLYDPLFIVMGDVEKGASWFHGDDIVFINGNRLANKLAMVSLCNHTIADGSILSLWAAFLNPGKKYILDTPKSMEGLFSLKGDCLFETHPDVQQVFMPFNGIQLEDLKHSKQLRAHALRVMAFVQKCIARLHEPEKLEQLLKELGKKHYGYKAKAKYVDVHVEPGYASRYYVN